MQKSDLEALVREGLSLSQMADRLGYASTGPVRRWIKLHEIVLPSAGDRRSWTDEQLRAAVSAAASMTDVLRALGFNPNHNGSRTTVKKYIEKLELDTSHWRGQGWNGQGFGKAPIPLSEILVEGSSYATHALAQRLLSAGLKERKCERCLLTEWQGEPVPVELDHINGVSNDHRWENLRMLCPNCHALTPTWRGRKRARRV